MTRGTLILLNPDKMLYTQEINGDMYFEVEGQNRKNGDGVYKRDSRGAKAYKRLKNVNTKKELRNLVDELYFSQFSEDEKGELVHEVTDKKEIKELLSFNKSEEVAEWERSDGEVFKNKWYFVNWFSDYLYLKNNTGETISLIDRDHKTKKVKDQEIVVLYFGHFEEN